jgi:hypothetical protein
MTDSESPAIAVKKFRRAFFLVVARLPYSWFRN